MRDVTWRVLSLLLLCGVVLPGGVGPRPAAGQDDPADLPDGALRAELRAIKSLYTPDGPIRLHFTLVNTSDETVSIPLEYGVSTSVGIALPVQLVLGSGDQRLLTAVYEDEEPAEVPPPAAPDEVTSGSSALRLAPHGAAGVEIDLSEHYPSVRYPGVYRMQWRPVDGRLGVLTAEFRVERRKDAILVTDYGKLTFALEYDRAPRNVESFLELARDGFYDGKTLHRLIPGFVLQGGCPKENGTGVRPDGKLIAAEFHDTPVELGTLLMARKPSDPDSASCQFFIALARLPELDGQYTVIGRARDDESLRTLQHLAEVPVDRRDRPVSPLRIRSVNLVDTDDNRIRNLKSRRAQSTTPASRTGHTPGAQ